jgi:hypothetical protein
MRQGACGLVCALRDGQVGHCFPRADYMSI